MCRINALLGLVLAGFMGTAAASGPGDQDVSINNTVTGLGIPFNDIYSFDIGSHTSEAIYAGALSAVPEPKDWMLMLAGIGLVGMMVERTKRRHF